MYEYRCQILKHLDSDTSRCLVELGCDVSIRLTVRWYGLDAPEITTDAGKASLAALTKQLPVGSVCILRTIKDRREKYGRYLGIFLLEDGSSINDWLIKNGYAQPYVGEVYKEAA